MLLIFTLPKTIPTWPGGQNIVWYFDPPNNQWQNFISLSYLLYVLLYQNNIYDFLSINDAFMLHYQHMISQSYKLFY